MFLSVTGKLGAGTGDCVALNLFENTCAHGTGHKAVMNALTRLTFTLVKLTFKTSPETK